MMKKVCCLVLAVLSVLCVCFVGCAEEKPQFVAPAFEANAVAGEPTNAEGEQGYRVLDARGVYKVGICGQIKVVDGKADVWFYNSAENNVWLKLRVQDRKTGAILGETGLLKPGEYVQSITFTKAPSAGTEITLRVMSYEPETYYSKGEVTLNTATS